MADNIELRIKVTGGDEAIRQFERLQEIKRDLERNRIELKIKKDEAVESIHKLTKDLREAREELKGLDDDSARKKELEEKIERLEKDLTEARDSAKELQDSLNFNADSIKLVDAHLDEMKETAEETTTAFERLGDAIAAIGSAISFAGDLSQLSADFADSVADAFGGMSDLFSFDFFDKITDSLADAAASAFVGDFEKIVSRYDIMNTFVDYMKVAGVDQTTAETALERINKSILGIPIGLDESAFRLRKYQMFLEDIDKATNLTIGVQNAIMAGGANQQMKNLAFTQIDRLIATGTLNNPRQWISLFNGLGVSLKYVAQEMGVAGMSAQDLANGLSKGDIPIQDFLDALMRIGEGSSVAGQEITKLLDLYRTQAQSWLENIGFAATRGAVNVMDALDQVLFEKRGTNIVSYLERVRNAINDLYGKPGSGTGITGWIESNPEKVDAGISAIERLFGAFGKFDLEKFGEGALDNLITLMDIITEGLGRVPEGKAEEFAAFATTLAGPLSDFLKSAGDMPWMLAVYDEFKDHDLNGLIDSVLDEVERASSVFSGILGIFPPEFLDRVIAFGTVWGEPLAKTLHAVGGGITDFGVGLASLKYVGFFDFIKMHPEIWLAAAAISGLAAAIGEYLSIQADIGRNISESLGLSEIDETIKKADEITSALKASGDNYGTTISEIDARTELAHDLIQKITQLNDEIQSDIGDPEYKLFDAEKIDELRRAVDDFNGLDYEGLSLKINDYTGALDAASSSTLEYADAEIEAAKKRAYAIAAQDYLQDIAQQRLNSYFELRALEQQRNDLLAQRPAYDAGLSITANWEEDYVPTKEESEAALGFARRRKAIDDEVAAIDASIAELENELDRARALEGEVTEFLKGDSLLTGPDQAADQVAGALQSTAGALETIGQTDPSVTEKLNAVAESIDAIAENGDALETINDIIEPLNSLVTAIGGGEDGEEVSLAQSIAYVQEMIQDVIDNEISNFLITLATLKDAFDTAKDSCDDLKKAIEEMANKASEKISTLDSFKEGLYRVSSAAFAATESVNALKAAIDSLEDKTVTVTYQEVHTGFAEAPAYAANGGPIYLAGGGGPRGTDTIPAWLSPGEFVMRRRAVDRFGAGFMSMINNLNIPGALGELMAHASIPGLGGIVSYDNRRTYDDHSTKNINVHTNSPSYAMRFASRYV